MDSRGPIGIAGAGRVAQSLARLLRETGQPVVAVASRSAASARAAAEFAGPGVTATTYAELPGKASRLVIAVPDEALEEVAGTLAETARAGIALHTCGARGPEALGALADRGIACGTLHPLQTVASPQQGAASLRGVTFAVAGDPAALAWAREIAEALGGTAVEIEPRARPLYHAAAVMASNYVVVLVDAAVTLMQAAGLERDAALEAVAPLLRTTVDNVLAEGPEGALTGPIQRGDAATVAAHLAALGASPASVRELYRAAGRQALDIARRRGLPGDRAQAIETRLSCRTE
jgi:predicted short-subunit dehydrogenase-like oxidoreductase (DUF2520 family)